ncbi:uncharacterized protein LOC114535461 [Dendronephthya gigantea]|uniref:uncharacterized protein LOC114535461 n=1 Tax=Dendronephthya gigantea TaxID=151771 RepID=UPI00106CCC1A|nr:uncharacterized protein LOC114535461 [Dendronephthya gigantea]
MYGESHPIDSRTLPYFGKRSFRLTKFVCNDVRVLSSIPESEHAKSIVSLDFDKLPVERALGVEWNVKEDVFGFRITERKKAATHRGILSDVSSMYDPLGFAAPFVLPAKRLLQQLCKDKIGWDEEISPSMLQVWERWLNDMPRLRNIEVPRYFEPCKMGPLKTTQLHNFCDASFDGYGAVSYLRFGDVADRVNCALVMAKSGVAPIKPTTIPRLELTAATVAVKQHRQINQELDLKVDSVTFWTDSTCVLRYINSESNRFKTFVGNRIALIHDLSSPTSWRYVSSKDNPANYASRGLRPTDTHEIDQWINGPDFLQGKEEVGQPVRKTLTCFPMKLSNGRKKPPFTRQQVKPLDIFIQHYSSWYRLLKGIAWLTRFVCYLCATHRVKYAAREVTRSSRPYSVGDHTGAGVDPLSVEELRSVKESVIDYVQCECFPDEVAHLKPTRSDRSNRRVVKKSSKLATLSPFMGEDNLIRVGGRLERAEIPFNAKHPIIIPSKHHIVGLFIRHYHEREGHSGVQAVLAAIQQDLWILQGRSRICYIIDQCIICRKKYEQPCEQMMASLPTPRVTAFERPFSSTGVDYFGPFLVKRGRCQVKRYGCIFTCLAMRAIHIEVAQSRNLSVKDLVLMVDKDCPRGKWPMAVVKEVFPDEKGIVRHVRVRTTGGTFKRDVRKLCLLEGDVNNDS